MASDLISFFMDHDKSLTIQDTTVATYPSTYLRASTLSKAFTTMSCFWKNASLYTFRSVPGNTLYSCASIFRSTQLNKQLTFFRSCKNTYSTSKMKVVVKIMLEIHKATSFALIIMCLVPNPTVHI